jgi:5,10-methylenetetrahydromethanopterin reductase
MSGRREISVAFQGDKTVAEYAALAELAEDLGFDAVSVYADLGFQPAIVPLLTMARATRRLRIGPAALNTWLLHPVEIAGQIAALDAVSGGRAYLGLVRGAWWGDPAPARRSGGGVQERPVSPSGRSLVAIRRVASGGAAPDWDLGCEHGCAGRRSGGRGEDRRLDEPGAGAGDARLPDEG